MKNLIDFSKLNGLVPCIVQDARTLKVLMLGFMNQEAYQKTVTEKKVTFYSRSKVRLWTKGETSGNSLEVVEIIQDCDNDTLLIKANAKGPVCHTGADTCFHEKNDNWNLFDVENIITNRKQNPKEGSYTTNLLQSGINKIAQKVGEEAVELVIEAKDDNNESFLNEAADLMFHFLVLLAAKNHTLEDVLGVLKKRNQRA
jgi:phosphoribosyl-ATP pyrophosphohydrolase/phosphoribosyl-AMP cyclohydrolase